MLRSSVVTALGLAAGALILAGDAGDAAAEKVRCQFNNTITSHPASGKYITRDTLQVWPLKKGDTPQKIAQRLAAVRDAYHTVPPPAFMKDLMFPRASPTSFEAWIASAPGLRDDVRGKNWFFVPNPEYLGGFNYANPEASGYDASIVRWSHEADYWKCRDGGAVGIGWYAHPGLEADHFDEHFDQITGLKNYKTQILDLTGADLQWLKDIRAAAVDYAENAYGYDPDPKNGDRLSLYFHWPTGGATNTLHLHTRVNYLLSPVEYNRSVMLDDLIAFFTKYPQATGMDFIAIKVFRANGLITNHIKNEGADRAIYAALQGAFGDPVGNAANPFKKIHEKIPFASADNQNEAEIQLGPEDPHQHSYPRYGEVDSKAKFDPHLVFHNPLTNTNHTFLTEELLTELKMEDLVNDTVEETLACIRPFFDGETARPCLVWKTNALDVIDEPDL